MRRPAQYRVMYRPVFPTRCSLLGRHIAAALLCALAMLALTDAGAQAGVANAGVPGASPTDPLAGLPWGNYTGSEDEAMPSYASAAGANRRLIGLVALRPRMRWYGPWYPDATIEPTARRYFDNVTGGRSDVMAQVAIFRLYPWEDAACRSLPTAAQQASYKRWIDGFAAGIGATRVALVLQPDLPFAFCVPHHSQLPLHMVAYAARVFSALPHTTVYIDAGAADWPTVGHAVGLLRAAGVRYTRGFALNATHYDATGHEIRFAAAVARGLARAGVPNLHAVINTSSNGRGFTFQQFHGPDFNNATPCTSRRQTRCVTLGIPPTTDVTSPRWGLSGASRRLAARYVDAYLWIGRPWLYRQSDPFLATRAILLARTTPF
jgi:endoglucanase